MEINNAIDTDYKIQRKCVKRDCNEEGQLVDYLVAGTTGIYSENSGCHSER